MRKGLFILFILFSLLAEAKKKAKWVIKMPIENEYYIGISSVLKSNANYRELAKKQALENIASEISINISSESILNTFENKENLIKEYTNQITINTKNTIEDYELVDIWENKKEYWVYYRLSKKNHKEQTLKAQNMAIENSIAHFEEGLKHKEQLDYKNAYFEFVSAFVAIEKYLGLSLTASFRGRNIFVANEIIKELYQLNDEINLTSATKELNIVLGSTTQCNEILVQTKNIEGIALSAIPINYTIEALSISKNAISDNKGLICIELEKIKNASETLILNIHCDLLGYVKNFYPENLAIKALGHLVTKDLNIKLHIIKPKIYIELNSADLSYEKKEQYLNYVESLVFNSQFELTELKSEANIYMLIKLNFKQEIGVFNFKDVLGGNIEVYQAKNKISIFRSPFAEVKTGTSFINDKSINDALSKNLKELEVNFMPQIVSNYLN